MDQGPGSDESSDDDRDPEESDETSGGGDVDQSMNSGGLKKYLDFFQYFHFVIMFTCCSQIYHLQITFIKSLGRCLSKYSRRV